MQIPTTIRTDMTTKKQKILLERLELYCKRLGVPVPRIVWTKKEMKKLDKFYRGPRHGRGVRGYCCKRINCIYIAYARHHTLKDLEHTLLHELIHFRFPSLQHGPKFEAKIKELKIGKTIWPAFDRAKFVAKQIELAICWRFSVFQNYLVGKC